MGRNHIHFITCEPWEHARSGMRHGTQTALYVDAALALQHGCEFVRSSNGVALSRGFDGRFPAEFFQKA
eukprot:906456-Alexandrium_andersonii.AAC.1